MFDSHKGYLNYSDDLDHFISKEISFEWIKVFIKGNTPINTEIIYSLNLSRFYSEKQSDFEKLCYAKVIYLK